MTRASAHGAPSRASREVGEHRDGDDGAAPNPATIRHLYDAALARSVGGDRSLQRYAAVLIAAPRAS
jgi:hypothetical protein